MVKNTAKLLTSCSTIYKISLVLACLIGIFPICDLTNNFSGHISVVLSYAYIGLCTLFSFGAVVFKTINYTFHKQITQMELIRYLNPSEKCVVGFISMAFSVIIESCCRYTWLFKIRNFTPQYLRFLHSVDYYLHSSSWLSARKSDKGIGRKELFIILTVFCYCTSYVFYVFRSVEDKSLNSVLAFIICFCAIIFQVNFTSSGLMLESKFRMLNAAVRDVLPFRCKAVSATRLQALKLCHLKLCTMVQKHNAAYSPGLQGSVFAVFCELVVLQYIVVYGILDSPQSQGSVIFIISIELITVDFLMRLTGFFLVSIHISAEVSAIHI